MRITKAFKRPNVLLFRTTAIDRLIGQSIFEIAVLLRLNYRVALPISYDITLLVLILSSLETTLISYLYTVLLIKKLPARRRVFLYTPLHYSETLEQYLAL
jgi:hypothetical protein